MLKTVSMTSGGGGGSSNITVNTTPIVGGTSDNVLYDNAGTVGEKTVTGTGSVVLSDSPTVTTLFTISGTNSSAVINSIYIGRGIGNRVDNLVVGTNLPSTFAGRFNTAIGNQALKLLGTNTGTDNGNTALGSQALSGLREGQSNTAVGYQSGGSGGLTPGVPNEFNTFIGWRAASTMTEGSSNNIYIGYNVQPTLGSGSPNYISNNSIYIGSNSAGNDFLTHNNEIVIGANAKGNGDNTITLGDGTIVGIYTSGLMSGLGGLTFSDGQQINAGTVSLGLGTSTSLMSFGISNNTQTVGIAAGQTQSGKTKTLNLGTNGDVGSTTNIAIGSSVSGATSTTTINGYFKPQQATTASAPAYVKGAIYFDTTLNKLRVGGATGWETITSV